MIRDACALQRELFRSKTEDDERSAACYGYLESMGSCGYPPMNMCSFLLIRPRCLQQKIISTHYKITTKIPGEEKIPNTQLTSTHSKTESSS